MAGQRRRGRQTGEKSAALPRLPSHAWLALFAVTLIFGAHWFYGALISDTSMVMNIGAALLAGAALLVPEMRQDVLRLKGLTIPVLFFGFVVFVALLTMTPWIPGATHPVWSYVGVRPGATTIDKSATLVETIKLLGLACLFIVGLALGARDERARFTLRLTIAAGAAFGLWAFIASVTGAVFRENRRLEAHFLNPNTAGTLFAILLLLAVAELLNRLRRESGTSRLSSALPFGAAALIFGVCLLDTASRGAAIALAGGVLGYVGFRLVGGGLKMSRAVVVTLAAMLILAALIALAGDRLVDRLFHSHESSIERAEIWRLHWRAFLDAPLFGYGLGGAESVNKTILAVSNFDVLWDIRAILNVYLQWLEEGGLVGALPMFGCLALVLAQAAKGSLRRSRMTGWLAALFGIDVLVLVHGATDFGLEVPSMAGFWAWLIGIQFALAQGSSKR